MSGCEIGQNKKGSKYHVLTGHRSSASCLSSLWILSSPLLNTSATADIMVITLGPFISSGAFDPTITLEGLNPIATWC